MLQFAKHSVCFDMFIRRMASVARKESPTIFQEAKIVLHMDMSIFHVSIVVDQILQTRVVTASLLKNCVVNACRIPRYLPFQ